jgi:O-antigen ligase
MSEQAVPLRTGSAGPLVAGLYRAASGARAGSARVRLVKLLVLATFLLCMSAPEELLFTHIEADLNPFVGATKVLLLGLGFTLLLLCHARRRHWAIAAPFGMLMAWSVVCWIVTGANILPFRNLVSSFGGILVLAGLCGAAEVVGGVRGMVRVLALALGLAATASLFLGVAGIQAMPGELALPGQLELFHGIGIPGYMVAACTCLIAWVLGRQLADPSARSAGRILLLLIIPALTFLRAYFIGIMASIIAAALLAWWRRRKNPVKRLDSGSKRLLVLVLFSLVAGAMVFFLKTGTREEGNELSGRDIIWPIEIAQVMQHPVFGLGPFGDIELLRFTEDLPQVGAAHSDYLGAAVCYGVPGLLLFCGALYGMWKGILRYRPVSLEERACRYAALLSLVGLSTTIIAENVTRDPRLFALHLLFPALCLSADAFNRQKGVR